MDRRLKLKVCPIFVYVVADRKGGCYTIIHEFFSLKWKKDN